MRAKTYSLNLTLASIPQARLHEAQEFTIQDEIRRQQVSISDWPVEQLQVLIWGMYAKAMESGTQIDQTGAI